MTDKNLLFDLDDMIEIIFGIFIGLFFFLGGSELWTIAATLSDVLIIFIGSLNIVLVYAIMKYIAGKTSSFVLFESVRYPIRRTLITYAIGLFFCFITISTLDSLGILAKYVLNVSIGFIPLTLKISIFANFLSTLTGCTVDLSISQKSSRV